MIDNVGVLVANVALNIWLIPRYGILGSAVAWAVSLAVVNLARLSQVWMTMRMLPFVAGTGKGVVAGLGAFAVGLAIRQAVPEPASLLVGAIGVPGVYIGLVTLLGVTREDRLVLRALTSRIAPRWARRPGRAVTVDSPPV